MTAPPKPPSDQEGFFWKTKTLEEMSNAEWESLCDGCARCCLEKLEDEDTGKIYFTHVSCKLLDAGLCACKDYANRSDQVPDCVRLTPENVRTLNWLPPSCGYKLVAEGRDLYWWHPLISGDPNTVHEAGRFGARAGAGHRERDRRCRSRRSHRAMAGAVAEARAAQKAATILATAPVHPSRDCDGTFAGRTHARNPLPRASICRLNTDRYSDSTRPLRRVSRKTTLPHEQVRTAEPSSG